MLRVFVYGTLKRGGRNHERYCRGLTAAEEACLAGRLYHLPVGYPMLVIPPQRILAFGTVDYEADAAQLDQFLDASPSSGVRENYAQAPVTEGLSPSGSGVQESSAQLSPAAAGGFGHDGPASAWEPIWGELLSFENPALCLQGMDALEGYHPQQPSHYRRVLVRLDQPAGLPVWTYVAPRGELPEGARQVHTRWP
jgi:gamma-glutamylcyclotransferase (GGCT)/AIG2-like uncharacterized protein YtfP